ncbi:MAG TPA: hypothetical protein VG983_10430 [Caulobacterales bacterium]|nr:hypothetical protein [Caulobacterales bacterium]
MTHALRAPGQVRLLLMVLAAICATIVLVDLASHRLPVIENHLAGELEKQRTQNGRFMYDAGYQDDGDYVLIDQLLHDDYSRGGVYFIGASEMKITLMPWLMTAEEKRLIHNYSLGDLRHSEVLSYVRMLIEEDGLLKAGAGKTTIFLGLSYQMARNKDLNVPADRYIKNLFERHGFYAYGPDRSIHRIARAPLDAYARLERDRMARFLNDVMFPTSRVDTEPQIDKWKIEHLLNVMRGDWRPAMAREVEALGKTIDYLQARGVRVRLIYPPNGSWQKTLPYDGAYRAMVSKMLATRHVAVIDQAQLLDDADFADATHALYSGQVKLHRAYLALAHHALEDMGTEPAPAPGE